MELPCHPRHLAIRHVGGLAAELEELAVGDRDVLAQAREVDRRALLVDAGGRDEPVDAHLGDIGMEVATGEPDLIGVPAVGDMQVRQLDRLEADEDEPRQARVGVGARRVRVLLAGKAEHARVLGRLVSGQGLQPLLAHVAVNAEPVDADLPPQDDGEFELLALALVVLPAGLAGFGAVRRRGHEEQAVVVVSMAKVDRVVRALDRCGLGRWRAQRADGQAVYADGDLIGPSRPGQVRARLQEQRDVLFACAADRVEQCLLIGL
jgi:hypothetical protein